MKAIQFIPLILLLACPSQAQTGGSIDMRLLRPLYFQVHNARELMQGQIIEQAVELRVRSGSGTGQVYASLSPDVRFPPELARNLMLRLHHTNAPASMVIRREMPLSVKPELVVSQSAEQSRMGEYIYVFDVILKPVHQFVSSGNAGFSINFSTHSL
jgi:hypothetical protein